jgi:diguanylate cyclase (GGDEF)-like protein
LFVVTFFLSVPAAAQTVPAAGAAPLVLDDQVPRIDLWPHVQVLFDPTRQLDIERILQQPLPFAVPTTAARTLGLREDAVWLRVPVSVSRRSNGIWVLNNDYPVINQIDVYVVSSGRVITREQLGNLVPPHERSIRGRTPALGLTLAPGTDYVLYLRVVNTGAMILPLNLVKPAGFLQSELAEQMLQGVLLGLGLCLLLYSLGQWWMFGERLFLKYALLISGSILFSLLQFGVGAQFIWPGSDWMELHVGGLSALVAATGSFLFIEQVLAGQDMRPWLSRVMKAGAALTSVCALLYASGLITVAQVTLIVSVLGLAPAVLGLHGALRSARRGDPVGYAFLLAWVVYGVSTGILIEVIKGRLEANWWTLHSFQIGATIDMLIFMRVLLLQTRALKLAAQTALSEQESLHSLAHTDALTGLPNRRALDAAVTKAITSRKPEELVAVYMLDLDGFKQVNDRLGHDIGDALLIEVARRLQGHLRSSDLIARLGGDEFLVLSAGLKTEEQVRELGEKLVKAIQEPMRIQGHTCAVGMTVGYGIAPRDGRDAAALLRVADALMYAGKQAGKGRVGSIGVQPLRTT